jgi:hypothetical protein
LGKLLTLAAIVAAIAILVAIWLLVRRVARPGKWGFSMSDKRSQVIHPRMGPRQLTPVEDIQRKIGDLSDLVRAVSNQNKVLTELVKCLVDREEKRYVSHQSSARDNAGGTTVVQPVSRSTRTPSFEDVFAEAARDDGQAEAFIRKYDADGWAKRSPQSANDGVLVKSAEQDWRRWEFLVMDGSNKPTERVVLPGIWYLNNPTALLSDGGRAGRKALGGIFDLKDGADIRLVRVAWGDKTLDGIKITQPGLLELPGLGSI